ncbi:MAG: hypothetical protein QXZ44_05800 [Ferroplasma sp.]
MSLESIINEIDSSMQQELNSIRDEYNLKIEEVTKNCNDRIEKIRSDYSAKSENDIKNIIRQYEDSIRLQSKKIIDDKRKELLNTAMEKLRTGIFAMSRSPEYQDLIKIMINEAKKQLGKDITIYCSEEEKGKVDALELKSISVAVNKKIRSGIIASSKDGKKLLDFQLSTIYNEISYDLELYLFENIK